ncbi:MAG: lysophospholipid acyltransferase family protein [Paludibacteraceae bacterium]|nr:1-acyl-sn-glycerol-3-phosphate acyltransferase [Bacteroidales bacterium]MDY4149716.1 lysophospholipid acyltransferase family protein [Paludibacteraceae bacterium]
MNKRYQDLATEKNVYIPDVGIDYPEDDPYARLYKPVYDRNVVVDANYPYLNNSLKYRFFNWSMWNLLLKFGLGLKLRIQMGLRFKGRENLKKYKDVLSGGAITIANHMYRLDCPCVLLAVKAKHTTRIPMFAPNFSTKDNFFLNVVGGVPIPPREAGITAIKKFNEAFDEFHRRGYWFHIFPEAARWDFYKPLRPFQKGAFSMSYKYNMPLLPCVITYRERTGIYRLFGKKSLPLLQVEIGAPIIPDRTATRGQEVERLREEAHHTMERMAGITHNSWPIKPEQD